MNGLFRHVVAGRAGAIGTLAGVGMSGLVAACGPSPPVSPLPAEMPSAAVTVTASAASPSASAKKPTRRTPPTSTIPSPVPSPTGAPACMGAVIFTVDAGEDGPPWPALCAAVGALLRLENHGPDGVSVDPPEKVACMYEAAVRECRFLEPGTVRFTITRETDTRTLTVVVVA